MPWVGLCLLLWAWCLSSLGLPRYHAAVFPRPLPPATLRLLRTLGWGLMSAGLAWFVAWKGWSVGLVFGSAVLMVSAIAWVLSLALLQRRSLAVPMLATMAASAWLLTGAL